MSNSQDFVVEARTGTGTSAARVTRRQGLVPGIIYGNNQAPQPIAMQPLPLNRAIHSKGFFSRVFNLVIDGKKEIAVARDVQFHPVTDQPMHVDFQRIRPDQTIHVSIPIEFTNELKSPGLKQGGVLNVILHAIELVCPANAIPEKLVVDLDGMPMNHSVHVVDLKLPGSAKVSPSVRDVTVATIIPPVSEAAEKAAEAASAAATTTTAAPAANGEAAAS